MKGDCHCHIWPLNRPDKHSLVTAKLVDMCSGPPDTVLQALDLLGQGHTEPHCPGDPRAQKGTRQGQEAMEAPGAGPGLCPGLTTAQRAALRLLSQGNDGPGLGPLTRPGAAEGCGAASCRPPAPRAGAVRLAQSRGHRSPAPPRGHATCHVAFPGAAAPRLSHAAGPPVRPGWLVGHSDSKPGERDWSRGRVTRGKSAWPSQFPEVPTPPLQRAGGPGRPSPRGPRPHLGHVVHALLEGAQHSLLQHRHGLLAGRERAGEQGLPRACGHRGC